MITVRHGIFSDYPRLISFDEFIGDRRLDLQSGRLCIADVSEHKTVGYATIDPSAFLGWPLLSRLCVTPTQRRTGIALALLSALLEDPRFLRLYTSTEAKNSAMCDLISKVSGKHIGYADELNLDGSRELLFRLK